MRFLLGDKVRLTVIVPGSSVEELSIREVAEGGWRMSKIKLLLEVVSDLRSLANSLQAVADAVAQGGQEQPDQTTEEKAGSETGKENCRKERGCLQRRQGQQSKPLTLEQVRAALAEKSRAGHTSEVKALLIKHGADKLSDIDPAEYPALLAEAEVL